ncbi:hypothetical protein WDW89_03625 [Deltaproteobacteria bacterium TL4]
MNGSSPTSRYADTTPRVFCQVLRWCDRSFSGSVTVVDQLLEKHHFRPRQAFKAEAGKKNIPQRDEQFENIERLNTSVLNKTFETGRKVAYDFRKNMRIQFDEYLPQWNYVAIPSAMAVSPAYQCPAL